MESFHWGSFGPKTGSRRDLEKVRNRFQKAWRTPTLSEGKQMRFLLKHQLLIGNHNIKMESGVEKKPQKITVEKGQKGKKNEEWKDEFLFISADVQGQTRSGASLDLLGSHPGIHVKPRGWVLRDGLLSSWLNKVIIMEPVTMGHPKLHLTLLTFMEILISVKEKSELIALRKVDFCLGFLQIHLLRPDVLIGF